MRFDHTTVRGSRSFVDPGVFAIAIALNFGSQSLPAVPVAPCCSLLLLAGSLDTFIGAHLPAYAKLLPKSLIVDAPTYGLTLPDSA